MAERSYHHGNLRAVLLETAVDLVRAGGPDALVVRDVSRRVGVSPNAVYRHFADREALRLAAVAQVEQELVARMTQPSDVTGEQERPAREVLRDVGLGYIDLALSEPGWFALLFQTVGPQPDPDEGLELPAPLAALVQALDALVERGELDRSARRGAEWPCWSAVHGFSLLALHGPLRGRAPHELRQAAERTVDTVVAGLLPRPDGVARRGDERGSGG